jgi:hypothetical protein
LLQEVLAGGLDALGQEVFGLVELGLEGLVGPCVVLLGSAEILNVVGGLFEAEDCAGRGLVTGLLLERLETLVHD